MKTIVYAGTWEKNYNRKTDEPIPGGEGVYALSLDTETGALTKINMAYSKDAEIMCISPDKRFLYAANESRDFDGGLIGSGGGVSAFAIDQKSGGLTPINSSIAYGACTAYVAISKSGRYLLAANHGSHPDVACHYEKNAEGKWELVRIHDDASIAVFRIREDGGIGELTDLKQFTGHGFFTGGLGQSSSHIHSVNINKDNIVIGCNRGADRLEIFRLNEETGELEEIESRHYRNGLAPRHLDFHPTLPDFYVCNENFPCVTHWRWNAQEQKAEALELYPALPFDGMILTPIPDLSDHETVRPEERYLRHIKTNTPSDIHVSPDGKYLYVSIRHPGYIATFDIDPTDGSLTFKGGLSLEYVNPRGFAISPDGKFMVIGHMSSNLLGVFPINPETGIPGACCEQISLNAVGCVRIINLENESI